MQLVGNVHRAAAVVLQVIGEAKEGVRRSAGKVGLELTDKEQHLCAALPVMDIALSGWRIA